MRIFPIMKATPGPWKAYGEIVRASGRYICSARMQAMIDEDEAEVKERSQANARLIATSPELLEACKLVDGIVRTILDESSGKKATNWGIVNDGLVAISRAIAKAEGK